MTPPVWPLARDAAEPWEESETHPTDVIASANGSESRVALRAADRPLVHALFRSAVLTESEATAAFTLIESNHTGRWTLPDWHTSTAVGTPTTSREGRLVGLTDTPVTRENARSVIVAAEFEVDSAEGQA